MSVNNREAVGAPVGKNRGEQKDGKLFEEISGNECHTGVGLKTPGVKRKYYISVGNSFRLCQYNYLLFP